MFGGFSLAAAFDPLSLNMNSVYGKLFSMLAMMLLFATDAHLLVIGGLLRSFQTMPVGTAWQPVSVTDVVTVAFGMFFATAVQIALPLIGVLFLADLGLALLTKVAPQLNAITIMFPAKIGLTLLLVGLSFAVLPDAMMPAARAALPGDGGDGRGERRLADGARSRTEKATPKKLKESRKEGQVARTQELGAWASLLVVALRIQSLTGLGMDRIAADPAHHGAAHDRHPGTRTPRWRCCATRSVLALMMSLAMGARRDR